MSTPIIASLFWDDENIAKAAEHGLAFERVDEVLDDPGRVVAANRKERRGLYLLVGRDHSGAAITVPVGPTHDQYMWRPVTAWLSKDTEQTMLQ